MVFHHQFAQTHVKSVNADAPKWHRECETRRDEATLVLSFFLLKKKYKEIYAKVLICEKAQGTVGFGARAFAHKANAAKPKKLSLPSVIISKIRFLRETKMS